MEPKDETLAFLKRFVPESYFPVFLQKCRILMDFLYETNKTLNLTRIPEESFWTLHAADSLAFAGEVALDGKKLCDVGCGAGFPGIPLKIAFPDTEFVLMDSLNKRILTSAEILTI